MFFFFFIKLIFVTINFQTFRPNEYYFIDIHRKETKTIKISNDYVSRSKYYQNIINYQV